MLNIGSLNNLIVDNEAPAGYYLRDVSSDDEAFMPFNMAPSNTQLGQSIECFVYLNSEGIATATTNIPKAKVGEYALMRAISIQDFGAFFDWGMEKDLLVPGNEQKVKVKKNEDYIVRVSLEAETDRIYGTTKLGRYIEESQFDIYDADKVDIMAAQKTDLGYKVIINKKYIGMIYNNEIFTKIQIGENYPGVVKKIRIDGLVDVALQTQGIKNLTEAQEKIISLLKRSEGKLALNDKSSPELIKNILGMSKKTFKNSIGMLYKKRIILITDQGIEITD